ncbi:MAG: YezD family protein [Chthoniobacterales bacterium]
MKNEQPEWLQIVREKVETLRYGVVQIVIHNSRVTLIERTEKTRLTSPGPEVSDRPDKLEATYQIGASHRTTG